MLKAHAGRSRQARRPAPTRSRPAATPAHPDRRPLTGRSGGGRPSAVVADTSRVNLDRRRDRRPARVRPRSRAGGPGFFPQLLGLAGAAAGGVLVVLALPLFHDLLDGVDPALRAIGGARRPARRDRHRRGRRLEHRRGDRPSSRRRRPQRPRPARWGAGRLRPGAPRRLARRRAPRRRAGPPDGRPGPAVVRHPDDLGLPASADERTSTSSPSWLDATGLPEVFIGLEPFPAAPVDPADRRPGGADRRGRRGKHARRPGDGLRPRLDRDRRSSSARVATSSRTPTWWPARRPSSSRSTAAARSTPTSSCSTPSSTSPSSAPPTVKAPAAGLRHERSAARHRRCRARASRRRTAPGDPGGGRPTATRPRGATCTAPAGSPAGSSSCGPTSSAATAAARSSCPTGRSAGWSTPRRSATRRSGTRSRRSPSPSRIRPAIGATAEASTGACTR